MAAEPGNADARLGLARALVQAGDWAEAHPLVQELAAQQPELWWPHFALAQHTAGALFGLLGTGFLGSIEAPDFDDPQAVAEWAKHFPAERVPAMVEALRKAPEDRQPLGALAQQFADEALAHLERARQAAPEEIAPPVLAFLVHWQLGMFQSSAGGGAPGVYDVAHEELFRLAEAHPGIPRLRLFANFQRVLGAMVRGRVGDFLGVWARFSPEDQAQLAADEAATRELLRSPAGRTPDAYELAGVYSLLRGDVEGALATLRESAEQDPKSGERWEAYVGVLTQAADLPTVQAAVEQALADVDNGTLRCALAKVYQKRNDPAQAEAQLEAAIALNDDRATFARVMLGVMRLKTGNSAGAVAPLEAAAPHWREDGLCEGALAMALALSGREADAPLHIARARGLSPNDRLLAHAAAIIGP